MQFGWTVSRTCRRQWWCIRPISLRLYWGIQRRWDRRTATQLHTPCQHSSIRISLCLPSSCHTKTTRLPLITSTKAFPYTCSIILSWNKYLEKLLLFALSCANYEVLLNTGLCSTAPRLLGCWHRGNKLRPVSSKSGLACIMPRWGTTFSKRRKMTLLFRVQEMTRSQ